MKSKYIIPSARVYRLEDNDIILVSGEGDENDGYPFGSSRAARAVRNDPFNIDDDSDSFMK